MTFPNVHYKRARIKNVKTEDSGLFRVIFEGAAEETYHCVVTRYGPTPDPERRLSVKTPPDLHRGGWLLNQVEYTVPVEKLGETSYRGRFVEPAKDDVARRLKEVLQQHGSRRVQPVNKQLYKSRLLLGSQPIKASVEYIDSDPQAWLSAKLRSGVRPTYEENLWDSER